MNKNILLIFLTLLLASPVTYAQDIASILKSIEENNMTLKALRATGEADRWSNRSEVGLEEPEIEFNYLRGKPSPIGGRTDLSVSQTFDIPTLSGLTSREAEGKNLLIDHQYRIDRMGILLEAKLLLIDLAYYDAYLRELKSRHEHASTIAEAQKKRLDRGEGSLPEYNNVRLSLATIHGEITASTTERELILAQLKRLNGGKDLTVGDQFAYPTEILPEDGSERYRTLQEQHPGIAYALQEVALSRTRISLSKSQALPSFSLGYMSEKTLGEHFQGISIGVSIPLWKSTGRIRQAKAAAKAAEARVQEARRRYEDNFDILYHRAARLKTTHEIYRTALADADNSRLLKIALDEGHISIIEYMVEVGLYYNTIDKALEAEREYRKVLAELYATEL